MKRSVAYAVRLLGPPTKVCLVLGVLFVLFGIVIGPNPGGIRPSYHSAWMQTARQIGLCMYSYSTDHNGNYPDGKSSTEVFQKLLDGNYVSDPNIFYIPLAGKIEPVVGQKLKPENVCFDVTSGVDSNAPDGLPLVFLTGYKATYVAGGVAVPIIKPYPQFEPRTWSQWLIGESVRSPGIAVFYKGDRATFRSLDFSEKDGIITKNPDGTIPNFVPPDFDAKGKTYRQLTPDGPLLGK